jgi:DNA-binding MarR family transcriptional regulator
VSTAARFDEIVHAPNRLQICAVLSAVSSADFAAVRECLGVADSVLSKHIRVLHEAGYVDVHKSTCASRVRTSMSMTAAGRAAYDGHLAALRAIVSNEGFRIDARRGDHPNVPVEPEDGIDEPVGGGVDLSLRQRPQLDRLGASAGRQAGP